MNEIKYIICGQMFDGIHDELLLKQTIAVQNGRIAKVGKDIPIPRNAEVIDLSHLTVTPGLSDVHVHSEKMDNPKDPPFPSEGRRTLGHLYVAQRSLERGFTTIRCFNTDRNYGIVDTKRLIDEGYFIGSRMVVSGHMMGSIGGHCDMSGMNGLVMDPELCELAQNRLAIGVGENFFRTVVQRDVKYGADFIKIMYSGGFLTPTDGPEDQQLSDDEMRAIIYTAHALSRTVTAHVYSSENIRKLLSFGIDGMEHCSMIDEETAELVADSGAYVVNTLMPYDNIIAMNDDEIAKMRPQHMVNKMLKYRPRLESGRQVLAKSRIKRLGFGSDIVTNYQSYDAWREYAAWLRAGFDPFRTLRAATSVNADIMGLGSEIGSIEASKIADLAGWHRNLLTDPYALSQCDFVMKGGIEYNAVYAVK
ncbi:MAG: amidohydrolase family protein [Oscillospiraceae bacterium]|nr:amidohydrolase family protein [Oscillospiraceae bacterium]